MNQQGRTFVAAGGGLAGLAAAAYLGRAGAPVILFERAGEAGEVEELGMSHSPGATGRRASS